MTTPISPISLSDIISEFGGPNQEVNFGTYMRGGFVDPNSVGPPNPFTSNPDAFVPIDQPDNGFGDGLISASTNLSFCQFRNQTLSGNYYKTVATTGPELVKLPPGVKRIKVTVIGAGGGAGGMIFNGDGHATGAGSAGQVMYESEIVLANLGIDPAVDHLAVQVGAGGLPGEDTWHPTNLSTGTLQGADGGASYVAKWNAATSTVGSGLAYASGGLGGVGSNGDAFTSVSGASVNGSAPGRDPWGRRNSFALTEGGHASANGYGNGGNGLSTNIYPNGVSYQSYQGNDGAVIISWGNGHHDGFIPTVHSSAAGIYNSRCWIDGASSIPSGTSLAFYPNGHVEYHGYPYPNNGVIIEGSAPLFITPAAPIAGLMIRADKTAIVGEDCSTGVFGSWISLSSIPTWGVDNIAHATIDGIYPDCQTMFNVTIADSNYQTLAVYSGCSVRVSYSSVYSPPAYTSGDGSESGG